MSFWRLYCKIWTDFTHCSSVFIVDAGQVNADWEVKYFTRSITVRIKGSKILSSKRNVGVALNFSRPIEILFLLLDEKSYLLASFGKIEDVKNRVDELNRQIDVCTNYFFLFFFKWFLTLPALILDNEKKLG